MHDEACVPSAAQSLNRPMVSCLLRGCKREIIPPNRAKVIQLGPNTNGSARLRTDWSVWVLAISVQSNEPYRQLQTSLLSTRIKVWETLRSGCTFAARVEVGINTREDWTVSGDISSTNRGDVGENAALTLSAATYSPGETIFPDPLCGDPATSLMLMQMRAGAWIAFRALTQLYSHPTRPATEQKPPSIVESGDPCSGRGIPTPTAPPPKG
ncbi:hypothetical protein V8F20_003606 [Naviculisporaceae sp. PSN 640]